MQEHTNEILNPKVTWPNCGGAEMTSSALLAVTSCGTITDCNLLPSAAFTNNWTRKIKAPTETIWKMVKPKHVVTAGYKVILGMRSEKKSH
jgi:hypothetical protein